MLHASLCPDRQNRSPFLLCSALCPLKMGSHCAGVVQGEADVKREEKFWTAHSQLCVAHLDLLRDRRRRRSRLSSLPDRRRSPSLLLLRLRSSSRTACRAARCGSNIFSGGFTKAGGPRGTQGGQNSLSKRAVPRGTTNAGERTASPPPFPCAASTSSKNAYLHAQAAHSLFLPAAACCCTPTPPAAPLGYSSLYPHRTETYQWPVVLATHQTPKPCPSMHPQLLPTRKSQGRSAHASSPEAGPTPTLHQQ